MASKKYTTSISPIRDGTQNSIREPSLVTSESFAYQGDAKSVYFPDKVKPVPPATKKGSIIINLDAVATCDIKLDPSAMKDFIGHRCYLHLANGSIHTTEGAFDSLALNSDLRCPTQSIYVNDVAGEIVNSSSLIGNLLFHSLSGDAGKNIYRVYGNPAYEVQLKTPFKLTLALPDGTTMNAGNDLNAYLVFEVELIE
jgi:hypothetical protein